MADQGAIPDWASPPPPPPTPDWAIAPAIHQQESGGAETAPTSPTGAAGGWQIEPGTFAQYAKPGEIITRRADNKAVGERIVSDLTNRTGGDAARVAVGYVSGPGNIAPPGSPTPWIKNPTVGGGSKKRVSDYVAEVLGRINPIGDAEAAQPAAPDWATPAPAAAPSAPDWATPTPAATPVDTKPGMIGGFTSGLYRGAKESLSGVGQTVTGSAFKDQAPAAPANDALSQTLAKPFSQGWSDPSWWTAQLGHAIGSSGPTVAGAVLGGAGATALAPEGGPLSALGGAALGGAGGNFIQELGPAYQRARADGLSHDDAVDRALKETGVGSAVAGVMSAVPGGKLLGSWAEGTAKRAVSEALLNIFGVQPAIGAAGQAASAAIENKPLTLDDLLTGYVQNAALGTAFHAAGAGRRALGRSATPEETALPPGAIRPEQPLATDKTPTEPPVVETPAPGDLLHTMQERGPIAPDVPVNNLGRDVNSPSINAPGETLATDVIRPEDINPNVKISLGPIYRGTEGGIDAATAAKRTMVGGDLGTGVYVTPDENLAATYGGGPRASVKAGTRAVHSYEAADLYPEEVAYVFGGMGMDDPVKIISGNGIPLYEGPWTGGTGRPGGAMEDALQAHEGLKVIVGTPDSVGVNQIAVRDPSILQPHTHPLAAETPPTLRGPVIPDEASAVPDWAKPTGPLGEPLPRAVVPPEPIVPDTIDVYHGSPHQFEEFDTSKIGTGEGAQSYGHGLYFAENEGVARSYQQGLTEKDLINKVRDTYDEFDSPADAETALLNNPEISPSQKQLLEALKKDDWLGFDYPHQAVSAALRDRGRFDLSSEMKAALGNFGNLYKSQILGHPDEFLDWDKPLSEQSPKVRAAIRSIPDYNPPPTATGEAIHDALAHYVGANPREASDILRNVGIKGIRYLDAKSRDVPAMGESLRNDIRDYTAQAAAKDAAGDTIGANFLRDKAAQRQATLANLKPPTRNYVVFDAKHAVPIERNGTPIQRVLPSSTAETVSVVNPGEVADGIKQASLDIGEALEPGGRGGQKPPAGGAPPGGDDGSRKLTAAAARMHGAINRMPDDPLSIGRMSWISRFLTMAQGIASRDRTSAKYLFSVLEKQAASHSLQTEAANKLREYGRLSEKDSAPIDKVLEYDRMTGNEAGESNQRTLHANPDAFKGRPWPLQLTKPGETVTLNAKQSRILNDVRGWLDQAWKQLAESEAKKFGYDGPFLTKDTDGKLQIDLPAIQKEFDGATDKGLRKSAERAVGIARAAMEGGRGGSYFPLSRYGDWTITVTPKAPVSGTGHPLANEKWFERVESGNDFDSIRGVAKTAYGNKPPAKVTQRIAELRQRFPEKDFDISYTKPEGRVREAVDLSGIDKVLTDPKFADPVTGERLGDAVVKKLYQDALAGFRKPSDNVPGYSTNFRRALGDYVRQWSASVANKLHGRSIDDAYLATQLHRDKNVARYWQNYKSYNEENESGVWTAARKLAFFKYLWGSPMSAAIQLTQTPLVTGMQLGGVMGPRGFAMAHANLARVALGLRADARGAKIDISKIPMTAEERAGFTKAYNEGRVNANLPESIGGGAVSDAARRHLPKILANVYDAGSSLFNIADQMNRMAAWLSYHQAAKIPGAAEKFSKVYAKDALFQEQVGRQVKPSDLANWAVNETQFLSGRQGSAPVMRGAGSVALQFQHYNANILRLLYKNFSRMGPEGKAAGTMMLLGIAGAAGVGGLPFVNDMEKLTNDGIKFATGIDPRIDAKLREYVNDTGFAKMMDNYMGWASGQTGEVIMDGPTKLTGLDLGRRIGLGNLLPESTDIYQMVPFLSATLGAASEAANRYKSGQPIGAAAALLPTGIGNPLKAYGAYPSEGVRQQRGQMVFPPSEVTPSMKAARALGATPTPIARRQQAMADQAAIKYATDEAAKNLLARIAGEFALADDAQTHGDAATAADHNAAAEGFIQANAERLANADVPDWQQIPTPRATQIRKTIARYLFPMQGSNSRNLRSKQDELAASPYLSQ